jgi:hypothetical protein
MTNKTKIFIVIFILLNIIILAYFNIRKNNKVINTRKYDLSNIYKNGEYISDIKIKDRHNNEFNISDYKNKSILFSFSSSDLLKIKEFNDSINFYTENLKEIGLNIVYITLNKSDTVSIIDKSKIFYDTDSLIFFNKFRVADCCGALILINRNHRVLFSTPISSIPFEKIINVLNQNRDSIINPKGG